MVQLAVDSLASDELLNQYLKEFPNKRFSVVFSSRISDIFSGSSFLRIRLDVEVTAATDISCVKTVWR